MSHTRCLLLICLIAVAGCTRMPVQTILLTNPYDHSLQETCVVIERKAFRQKDDSLHPVIYDREKARSLPVQVDDLDSDGSWDEASFLVSLKPGETFTGRLEWLPQEDVPVYPIRTNVYLGISRKRNGYFKEVREEVFPSDYECRTPYQYQFEGVGWENDVIAFRTYCDRRNGKDIFGKTTSKMILSDVGKIENYHELQSWGMDILKVGNSLGIGAVGAIKNGKIYRLGDTRYHDFQIIVEGPVRSVFKLGFDGWIVNGDTLSATETITITAGRNGFSNRFEVTGDNVPDTLISGLSMIGIEGELVTFSNQDWPGISLSGINDLDGRFLGMAVFTKNPERFSAEITLKASEMYDVKSPEYQAVKFHPYISDTYYLTTTGPVADFYVFTLWEGRYPEIHTPETFHKTVNQELLSVIHAPEVVMR